MIREDLTVVDIGSDSWPRLIKLPLELASMRPEGPRPEVLLVVFRGLRVLKAVRFPGGLPLAIEWRGTSKLAALAEESGCDYVIAIEETALSRVFGHAQRGLDYNDDMVEQWAGFLRGAAREWRRTIFTYPAGPSRIPVIPYGVLEAVLCALVPDNTLNLFAVTEKGRAWTSVVSGWRDGDLWLITSLDAVGMEEGDLRNGGMEAACRMIEQKFAGKSTGIVVELSELRRLAGSRFPLSDVLLALNSGDIMLHNVPLRWKALAFCGLGLAGLRSLLRRR